jgi:hypothetical protein
MKINLTEKTRNIILEKLVEKISDINIKKIKKVKINIIDLESYDLIDKKEIFFENKFTNLSNTKFCMFLKIQELKLIFEIELFIILLNNEKPKIELKIEFLKLIRKRIISQIKNIFNIKNVEIFGNIIYI